MSIEVGEIPRNTDDEHLRGVVHAPTIVSDRGIERERRCEAAHVEVSPGNLVCNRGSVTRGADHEESASGIVLRVFNPMSELVEDAVGVISAMADVRLLMVKQ